MKVTLYSTGCPKCKILETKLAKKNINYEIFDDVDEMIKMGFQSVPILKVDEKVMDFGEAVKWLNDKWLNEIGDNE